MSILESIRKGTDSTSTRIFIGVVAFAFIVWGAGRNRGRETSIYATVNGTAISDTDFARMYRALDQDRDRNRSEADEKIFRANVLDGLIAEEALAQEANRLGLAVSPEEIARQLKKNPSFQKDGAFDQKVYEKVLKNMGLSAERYEASVHHQLLLGKLGDLATTAVGVSDAEVHRAWTTSETKLDLTFIRLPRAKFLTEVDVTDAERDAFIAANGDKIAARYKEAYERSYNLPERYTLRQILLRTDSEGVDKAAIKAKADEVRALATAPGADFAALAVTWSEDLTASSGGSLGQLAATQLDPVVATAASATPVGQVSPVVETSRGYLILKVEAKDDARIIAIEEARPAIATDLIREQKVTGVVNDFATKLIAAWKAAGAPPRDLTEPEQLAIDQTGPFPLDAAKIPSLGDVPLLSAVLSGAKPGDVLATPFTSGENTFVVALSSRTEPDPATFDTTKGMAKAKLLMARREDFIEAWKSDVIARSKVVKTDAQ